MKQEDMRIGMKVKRTSNTHNSGMKVGETGAITGFRTSKNGDTYAFLNGETNPDFGHSAMFLEPAEPEPSPAKPKFHVGQRVRCVDNAGFRSELNLNDIYTVETIDKDGDVYLKGHSGVCLKRRFVPADPEPIVVHGTMFTQAAVDEAFSKAMDKMSEETKPSRDGAASILSTNYFGINWGHTAAFGTVDKVYTNGTISVNLGKCDNMETETAIHEKLAKRMKDKFAGYGGRTPGAKYTVFLEKAGELDIAMRDVSMSLTVEDIEELMQKKGMTKALGTFEIASAPDRFSVSIVKFVKPCCEEK